jgi:hypothetical protein
MFDIDKYLDELNIKDIDPPVDLVERTMKKKKGGFRVMKKKYMFALGAAAVLLFGIMIGAYAFDGSPIDEPIVTGYYTVDINPSICLGVDADDKVAKVISQNEDADALLSDLDFKGDDVQAAILELVNAAKAAGYLADEEKYVLVGYFSKDGFFASALQTELENSLGNMVHLLLVSGTLENKTQADGLGVSAGLLALSKETEGVSISKTDGVKEVVAKCQAIENPVPEEPDSGGTPTDNDPPATDPYIATTIKGSISGTAVNLSWNKIDRSNFDGYKVMYSFTDSTPVYGDGHDGCRYTAWITDANTTSLKISNVTTLYGYAPGKTCYFSITALYDGHAVKKPGNAIGLVMPSTPAPTLDKATIDGALVGTTINLSWTKVSQTDLDYNKVMFSLTDSTPVYGESGCDYYEYYIDSNVTSVSINLLDPNDTAKLDGYVAGTGQKYYFSITSVYKGVNSPGTVIQITLPLDDTL